MDIIHHKKLNLLHFVNGVPAVTSATAAINVDTEQLDKVSDVIAALEAATRNTVYITDDEDVDCENQEDSNLARLVTDHCEIYDISSPIEFIPKVKADASNAYSCICCSVEAFLLPKLQQIASSVDIEIYAELDITRIWFDAAGMLAEASTPVGIIQFDEGVLSGHILFSDRTDLKDKTVIIAHYTKAVITFSPNLEIHQRDTPQDLIDGVSDLFTNKAVIADKVLVK